MLLQSIWNTRSKHLQYQIYWKFKVFGIPHKICYWKYFCGPFAINLFCKCSFKAFGIQDQMQYLAPRYFALLDIIGRATWARVERGNSCNVLFGSNIVFFYWTSNIGSNKVLFYWTSNISSNKVFSDILLDEHLSSG